MDDDDRVRKKRREEKVHFTARGWYNTITISDNRGERKENSRKKHR